MLSESGLLPRIPATAQRWDGDWYWTRGFVVSPHTFSCHVVADRNRALPGRVMDLSPDGIRLAVDRWIEPGTILGIEWQNRFSGTPCFLLAVIHTVVAQSGSEWVVTGRFAHKLNADVWHMLR